MKLTAMHAVCDWCEATVLVVAEPGTMLNDDGVLWTGIPIQRDLRTRATREVLATPVADVGWVCGACDQVHM